MSLDTAFAEAFPLAPALLDAVRDLTRDGEGVTRASYGEGETAAAGLLAKAAAEHGLIVSHDPVANLVMTLPGRDRSLPAVMIGSHLDSTPVGGNYDGLAGVVSGLVVADALRRGGIAHDRDLVVLGIRGEENVWFGAQHIGSRATLGLLSPALLESATRADTGRSLGSYMAESGVALEQIRARKASFHPGNLACYLELHIEQASVLEDSGLPAGIVTGIRGNVRCQEARCTGEYGHSGTVPLAGRRDAVMATAELVHAMNEYWRGLDAAGTDMVMTFGRLFTDARSHGTTVVPGEVTFSFDARSHDQQALAAIKTKLMETAEGVAARTGVAFSWGAFTGGAPVPMDETLRDGLRAACARLGVPTMDLPSGAGHDAQDFVEAGIPSAMLFVRNSNGSHNPHEHLEMDDLRLGTRALLEFVAERLAR